MSLTDRQSAWTSPEFGESRPASVPVLFSVDMVALEDETILRLHGELDSWTQRELVTALRSVDDGVERLVLDLSDLTFIDASGIGIIHQRRTIMEERGGTLLLRSPNVRLTRILEITGMMGDRWADVTQHRIVLPLPARAYERSPLETT